MEFTTNYNLRKPDKREDVRISDINKNMDTLDEKMHDMQVTIDSMGSSSNIIPEIAPDESSIIYPEGVTIFNTLSTTSDWKSYLEGNFQDVDNIGTINNVTVVTYKNVVGNASQSAVYQTVTARMSGSLIIQIVRTKNNNVNNDWIGYLLYPASVKPIDNLNSTDVKNALSANQGRVLKGLIDAMDYSIGSLSSLETTNKTNIVSAINEVRQNLITHIGDNSKHLMSGDRAKIDGAVQRSGDIMYGNLMIEKDVPSLSLKPTMNPPNNNKKLDIIYNAAGANDYGVHINKDGTTALIINSQKNVQFMGNDNVWTSLQDLKSSVSNGKAQVANAITQKGVPTAANAEFATMANNISQIQNTLKRDSRVIPLTVSSSTARFDYSNTIVLPFNVEEVRISVQQIMVGETDIGNGAFTIRKGESSYWQTGSFSRSGTVLFATYPYLSANPYVDTLINGNTVVINMHIYGYPYIKPNTYALYVYAIG